MKGRIDLTEGKITEKLIKLSLPIMATSFIQMGYNMIDMIWVGKAGSNAVAAVGTAGFYPWLAMAFIMISKVGGEIKVAQSIGENNKKATKSYIKAAIEINIILAILYSITLISLNKQLVGIFDLGDMEVISMSRNYLVIIGLGMIFYFINPVLTSIFNGMGNSKIPFRINAIGLVINIILDPVLIFGVGKIPGLGVSGAAIATVCAQAVVSIVFITMIIRSKQEYFKIKLFRNIEVKYYKILYKLGLPVALQSGMFTLFSMAIGVVVASFGPVAVAVQKVGSQIEAISWMSAEGLSVALGSFVGQNYGAKKHDRIIKGCKIAIVVASIWGVLTTSVLIFGGKEVFSIFISEADAIEKGASYLTILGLSQWFMCIEITSAAVFKGLGRTYIPSIVTIVLTGARIPMAYLLSKPEILGLDGIWWSITISSILKGIVMISILISLYKLGKLFKDGYNAKEKKDIELELI